MPLLLVARLLAGLHIHRLQQVEGDIRRLEVLGLSMRDVVRERAQGGGARRGYGRLSMRQRGGVAPGEQAGGDRLRVALDARELSRDQERRPCLEL